MYEAVIGLEVHVRLGLNTKLFCRDANSFGEAPNELISEISLAYPGTLPLLNKEAIRLAVMMGIACHSKIAPEVVFDRKNYFYPDLPKGYQLTQDRLPICQGGYIPIQVEDQSFQIELTKIHLEEDAGKSIHHDRISDVDYNRAGTALIEMVTEPVMHTPEQAYEFLYEVRRMVRYLEIGDGNMEEGSLRCDANVSVRLAGELSLGNKVELKNMNSLTNVKKAILHEIDRQKKKMENGEVIVSETRSYDAVSGHSTSMREKETLTDYRYFPEPDLVPEMVDAAWLEGVKSELPELGHHKQQRFISDLGLSTYEASLLTRERAFSIYFEEVTKGNLSPKVVANWMLGPVLTYLNQHKIGIEDYPLSVSQTTEIVRLMEDESISFSFASQYIHPSWVKAPDKELSEFATSDTDQDLNRLVQEVLGEMPREVAMYKQGKKKLFGALMGSLLKKSGRNVDPKKMKDLLLKALD